MPVGQLESQLKGHEPGTTIHQLRPTDPVDNFLPGCPASLLALWHGPWSCNSLLPSSSPWNWLWTRTVLPLPILAPLFLPGLCPWSLSVAVYWQLGRPQFERSTFGQWEPWLWHSLLTAQWIILARAPIDCSGSCTAFFPKRPVLERCRDSPRGSLNPNNVQPFQQSRCTCCCWKEADDVIHVASLVIAH